MQELQDPVVASLAGGSAHHPYSSLAMSSNRKYAIVAGKDTLQLMEISPKGLSKIRSMRISQVSIKMAFLTIGIGRSAVVGFALVHL